MCWSVRMSSSNLYDMSKNDFHTASISFEGLVCREAVEEVLTTSIAEYCSKKSSKINPAFALGYIYPTRKGCYMYVFFEDSKVFNLFTGKDEFGLDLFDLQFPSLSADKATDLEASCGPIPIDIDDLDISLEDISSDSEKAIKLRHSIRSLTPSIDFDQTPNILWKPPVLSLVVNDLKSKVVPANYLKDKTGEAVLNIIDVPLRLNQYLTEAMLEEVLDRTCLRSGVVEVYIGKQHYSGHAPLVLKNSGGFEIHFNTPVLAKMASFMLSRFTCRGGADSPSNPPVVISCELRKAATGNHRFQLKTNTEKQCLKKPRNGNFFPRKNLEQSAPCSKSRDGSLPGVEAIDLQWRQPTRNQFGDGCRGPVQQQPWPLDVPERRHASRDAQVQQQQQQQTTNPSFDQHGSGQAPRRGGRGRGRGRGRGWMRK